MLTMSTLARNHFPRHDGIHKVKLLKHMHKRALTLFIHTKNFLPEIMHKLGKTITSIGAQQQQRYSRFVTVVGQRYK